MNVCKSCAHLICDVLCFLSISAAGWRSVRRILAQLFALVCILHYRKSLRCRTSRPFAMVSNYRSEVWSIVIFFFVVNMNMFLKAFTVNTATRSAVSTISRIRHDLVSPNTKPLSKCTMVSRSWSNSRRRPAISDFYSYHYNTTISMRGTRILGVSEREEFFFYYFNSII